MDLKVAREDKRRWKLTNNFVRLDRDPHLFEKLPQGRFPGCFTRIEFPTGKCDLTGVVAMLLGPNDQGDGPLALRIDHATEQHRRLPGIELRRPLVPSVGELRTAGRTKIGWRLQLEPSGKFGDPTGFWILSIID